MGSAYLVPLGLALVYAMVVTFLAILALRRTSLRTAERDRARRVLRETREWAFGLRPRRDRDTSGEHEIVARAEYQA